MQADVEISISLNLVSNLIGFKLQYQSVKSL